MSRTVVDGTILVPKEESLIVDSADPVAVNAGLRKFELNGEVLKSDEFDGDRLHESFRYRFEMTDGEVTGDSLPLAFRRYLRPGTYTLRIRLEEVDTGRFFRSESELVVPKVDIAENAAGAPSAEMTAAREDLEATLDGAVSGVRLSLQVPAVPVFTGYQRFEASVDGEVSKIAFLLDGKEVLRRSREPWSVEMKLGDVPRPHFVEAVALAADGAELARDRVDLNQGKHRFAMTIVEPKPDGSVDGNRFSGSVTLRAQLQLPKDQKLDRVEIYRNETLVSTLYQEPYEQPIQLDDGAAMLRTVAYLEDGNSTEDVVLLNVPGTTERLRVHLVELSIGAKSSGRPVLDLKQEEVSVVEKGQSQELLRFAPVRDLPLHLLVLLDTSGSMQDRIEEMRDVALRFFEEAVSPKDRVSVVTFHEQQTIRVDFTSDFEEMKKGLRYLSTGQGTNFYDALIFSLYRFQGIRGQRALLLLSDGKDSGSKTTWDEALEYARQSGVTIYPIGLKGIKRSPQASGKLDNLAKESGGRSWFVKEVSELEGVYKNIVEELRARYLISYQTVVEEGQGFQPVSVSTTRQGVVIEAPSGYYP